MDWINHQPTPSKNKSKDWLIVVVVYALVGLLLSCMLSGMIDADRADHVTVEEGNGVWLGYQLGQMTNQKWGW